VKRQDLRQAALPGGELVAGPGRNCKSKGGACRLSGGELKILHRKKKGGLKKKKYRPIQLTSICMPTMVSLGRITRKARGEINSEGAHASPGPTERREKRIEKTSIETEKSRREQGIHTSKKSNNNNLLRKDID